jgi:hypothetical protein
MKTIIRPFFISLLIITVIAFLFSNCHKDKDCPAVVTVKYLADTTKAVPNATVQIHKQDVNVQGVTDANGQFRYTFDLEAILDVNATAPPDSVISVDTLYGQGIIRLVPGKTVYKTVFVN